MSVFTGLLNEKVPFSAAEIAMSSNIPMLLISGVNKGGIESAAVDLVAHANMLEKFGVNAFGGNIVDKRGVFFRTLQTRFVGSKAELRRLTGKPQ